LLYRFGPDNIPEQSQVASLKLASLVSKGVTAGLFRCPLRE
jgi:hypothetical protein